MGSERMQGAKNKGDRRRAPFALSIRYTSSALILLMVGAVAVSWGQAALSDIAQWRDCESALGASCLVQGRPLWALLTALLAIALAGWHWVRSRDMAIAPYLLVLAGLLSSSEGIWNSGWANIQLHLFLALLPATLYTLHGVWLRGGAASLPRLLVAASGLALGMALLGRTWAVAGAWVVVSVGGVGLLRLWAVAYHQRPTPSRPCERLAALATGLLPAPFLLLTLLPELSRLPYVLPADLTLPLLGLSLGAVVLLGTRRGGFPILPWIGGLLNGLLLSVAALALYTVIRLVLGLSTVPELLAPLLLLSSGAFALVAHHSPRLTQWLLYADEPECAALLERFIHDFTQTPTRATVEQFLTVQLPPALDLSRVWLYLRPTGRIEFVSHTGSEPPIPSGGELVRVLASAPRRLARGEVQERVADAALTPDEQGLVGQSLIRYWLPFQSQERLHGFLLVGARERNDAFPPAALALLDDIRQPIALALHTIYLLERLASSREEIRRTHRSSLMHVERERFTLAQELHDGPLQTLLALIHPLEPTVPAMQAERAALLSVVQQLRNSIRVVRPVGLRDLGLPEALKALVREQVPLDDTLVIELQLMPPLPPLSDEAVLALYRVAQEGLRNIQRHSAAHYTLIALRGDAQGVTLTVQDDGVGFEPPLHLTELALADHFGLAGIAERLHWAGGHLTIHSTPGHGTELRAWVPTMIL